MPATPATGRRALYPKADGWYSLDSAGVETALKSNPGAQIILLNDSDVDTSTSTSETIVKSVTIPANTLDADSTLFVKMMGGHIGSAPTATWKIRIGGVGGTVVASFAQSTSGGTEMMVMMDVILSGKDATNSQRGMYWNTYPSAVAVASLATTIDWTAEQVLCLTAQAGGGTTVTLNSYYMYAGYVK